MIPQEAISQIQNVERSTGQETQVFQRFKGTKNGGGALFLN